MSITTRGSHGWRRGARSSTSISSGQGAPIAWAELSRLRANGVRSLDPAYQSALEPVVSALEWASPRDHPSLRRGEDPREEFAEDVYRAFVGDDPEWTVGGTLAGSDQTSSLATVDVPALVITGRDDRVTTPRSRTPSSTRCRSGKRRSRSSSGALIDRGRRSLSSTSSSYRASSAVRRGDPFSVALSVLAVESRRALRGRVPRRARSLGRSSTHPARPRALRPAGAP